jgi:hypothetical protein
MKAIKGNDAYIMRGDGESYMTECDKHGVTHSDDDPCPVCYERYEQAGRIRKLRKKLRDLKAASNKAHISDGTIDAINRVWHYVEIENNARVY